MSENEQQLLRLLVERSFQRGDFTLASGAKSTWYIDGKTSEVFSRSARCIGEVICERTKHLDFDAIGGLEVGAVPLTTATVIAYDLRGREMGGFWVRDKTKTHGTRKLIEGGLASHSRVVIVDDVITSGGSALKAIKAVQEIGCDVVMVLALVDRLAGARKLIKEHGIDNYQAVYTIRDFGIEAPADGECSTANTAR